MKKVFRRFPFFLAALPLFFAAACGAPAPENYKLTLDLRYATTDADGNRQTFGAFSEDQYRDLSVPAGQEVHFYAILRNLSAKKQTVSFSERELLYVLLYRDGEFEFSKSVDDEETFTFPNTKGCRCYSEQILDFSYAFTEKGVYRVSASSDFRQGKTEYYYSTPQITVTVE